METAAERIKRQAAELIGVKARPAGYQLVVNAGTEAFAYHQLNPYPWFHFQDWKTEDRGPLPRCMPFVKGTVVKGAKWLFGKPVEISVPGNPDLEKYLREAWELNRMPARMVMAATKGGYEGGIFLKWAYDETANPKVIFQILSVRDQCRLFFDPHDQDCLLMARIQYAYYKPTTNTWWWYREEWTAESEVHYDDVEDTRSGTRPINADPYRPVLSDPDEVIQWGDPKISTNPFKVIPGVLIKNAETDCEYGAGDWWGLFRVVDNVNLTYHGMNKSNQQDADPNYVFIDVDAEKDDVEAGLPPGGGLSLKSDEDGTGASKKGSVQLLEPKGALRPAMMEYAKEVLQQCYDAIGAVKIRQDEISNKGNLTTAVLTQLYAPLIETTEEKRKTYGEDGICKFLEACAVGLTNFGAKEVKPLKVKPDNLESYDVQIKWAPYFDPSVDEQGKAIDNNQKMIDGGLLTHERAIENVAAMHQIKDVPKLKEELAPAIQQRQDKAQADVDAAKNAAKGVNEQKGP